MGIISKIKADRFFRLHKKAIKEMGGCEYASMDYKDALLSKMSEIKERKRSRIVDYIIGGVVSLILAEIVRFAFKIIQW